MKKSLFFAVIAFFAAALLPVSFVTAAEVDIIVLDPSFEETPALGQGAYIYLVDYTGPWMSDLGNGAFIVSSYYGGDLPAHSGSHKVHTTDPETTPIRFDHIYQILDETFVEGRTYTLRVWVENYRAGTGVVDDWGLFLPQKITQSTWLRHMASQCCLTGSRSAWNIPPPLPTPAEKSG